MSSDLDFAGIRELGARIRSGAVSPTELAERALERLDTVGRELNAVVTLTPDLVMDEARRAEDELAHGVDRGPLHGIPYGAKDLLATEGIPTSWGAPPFKDQLFDQDAAVVERLREAGAVLVAKLAMVECAGGFGYEQADAALTGPGLSAWSREAWGGGSSSGSGASVGAGCLPFAIGSETWGSILVPAAFNGVTGLRPTYGRVSRRGAMALSWTMDKIGPLTRSAEDGALVLAAIQGKDSGDPTTSDRDVETLPDADRQYRFAVLRDGLVDAQPAVAANFEASLDVLRSFGSVEEVDLPNLPWDSAASIVVMAEAAAAFEDFIISGDCASLTAPEDRIGLYHALTVPAVDYINALRIRRLGSRALDQLLAGFDAIVAPTLPYVAIPITDRFDTWFGKERGPSLGGAGNLCGLPSIAVPNGFGERDLPTSLEFMGRAYDEHLIIGAAMRFQELTDWSQRHPVL
jgi:aspartyl-tRNA(Asn)/glutamyl-tRNA(Gln) amidotransferase subunit A